MNTHYQRLIQILKPNSKEIGQVYTLAIFKGLVALSLPLGIQSIINFIQGGSVSSSWVVLSLLIGLAVAFNGYLQLSQMRLMENIQQHLFARAAFDISAKLPQFKLSGLKNYYAPELMNRFFEVLNIQKSISKIIIELTSAIMQILLGLVLLSLYHPFFVIFSLSLIVFMWMVIMFTATTAMNTSIKESDYKYKVVSWLEELARVRHSFKMAGHTTFVEKRTDNYVSGYLESREKHFRILNIQYKWLVFFKVIVTLFLLLVGGMLVINQQMNIGQFIAAEIIIVMVIESAEKIILNLENFYDLFTSAIKLENITRLPLDNQSEKLEISGISSQEPAKVDIINLDFSHENDGARFFQNMNFSFERGGKYILTGSGGSGKSTLLHLVAGLYQPQAGNICINELPVANYDMNDLYQQIGNCLKEEMLFEGTILENITLGRDSLTTEEVNAVMEKVFLKKYVQELPMGLMTAIQPLGSNLPGSMVQKILLARTLVKKPKLLLMEQSLDAVPEKERAMIMQMLFESPEFTMIVIGHYEYTKSHDCRILEIRNGQLNVIEKK